MVEGLLLININPCAEGWINWAAHKVKLPLIVPPVLGFATVAS